MQHKAIRLLATGVVGLLILASSLSLTQPALAQTENQPKIQTLDFSNALIRLEDLPGDFGPLGSELIGISAEQMLGWLQPTLITDQFLWSWKEEGRFIPAYAPSYGIEEMVNLTGYTAANAPGNDSIFSWLKPSLSRSDQEEWDIAFTHSDEFLQNIIDAHDDPDAHELPGYDSIGDTRFAYTYRTESSDNNGYNRYERVRIRRGPVLIEIKYGYLDGEQPLLDLVEIARLLDDRVADVVGRNGTTFRPAGPLVPELTTYIPTPLDVSPEPGVIGTNLLLAALLMLPFAVAAELFTRTLGEHENALQRFRLLGWLSRLQKRLVETTGTKIVKRPALRDTLKLIGVVIFYGLVFSLLDRTWNPFSLQGLILFLSMTIAYGVVGIADDIIQWRAIRKWGLAADLTLRPTNLLLAMGSTATSRLLSMVPGLMFGTPEALRTEESQFDDAKRNSLLKISAITFIIIGLGVWLPTIATAAIQKTSLSENILNVIGGVEGFLLVIFAVTLENLFVQMLGFPGGFGQALKRRNKWLWLAALTGVTFLFYHTLINPRGELAEALQQANIWLFFGIAIAFVIFAFSLHFYLGRQRRVHPLEEKTPTPSTVPQQIVAAKPATIATPIPLPAEAQAKPILIPISETKQCPVCSNQIKAEARICRYCKATFTVRVRGYCPTDHEVMEVTAEGKCSRCNNEVTDLHAESRLLKAPAVLPVQANQATVAPVKAQTSTDTTGDTKPCPACGQTIKAEALICRFCRARFEVRTRGYCLNDHTVVDVKDGKCVLCGGDAQDVHTESKLVGEIPPAVSPKISAPPAMPQSVSATISTDKLKRPGCVTAYVILLLLGAGLFTLSGLMGDTSTIGVSPSISKTIPPILLTLAFLYTVSAIGLWMLKNWGRIIIMVLTGLTIASCILTIITAFTAPAINFISILANLITLGISASIFGWFKNNGKYFKQELGVGSKSRRESVRPVPASVRTTKAEPSSNLRAELLKKIEAYAEGMHYLATCGDFNEQKFATVDSILERVGAGFGPAKRKEMLAEAAHILPTRSTGGVAELHIQLQEALAQGFQMFNEILAKSSPTPDTAREVMRIIEKYKVKA